MATSNIAKQYTHILALWPKDALRPNLPFTRPIERRAVPYGVKPVSPPQEPTKKSKDSPVPPEPFQKPTPQEESAQINALFSLLENRYAKKYPLPPDVLKPASNPEHYDRLMAEIERAPEKSWWSAKVDEWKMKIRWK